MIRYLTIAVIFALLIPTQRAAAPNNTVGGALLGGAAGAIIGGAATAGLAVRLPAVSLERQRAQCSARNWSRGQAGTIGTMAAAGFVTAMAATTAYRGAIAPEPVNR